MRYRTLLIVAVVALLPLQALVAQSAAVRSMKGAAGVAVFITVSDAVREAGYPDSLFRAAVEKQLRDALIVIADTARADSSHLRLRISVDMIPADARVPGLYAMSTRHSVQQLVALRRDSTAGLIHEAETWKSSTLHTFAAHEMSFALQHSVRKQTFSFILAYQSANNQR
jgi:hypothetical protein